MLDRLLLPLSMLVKVWLRRWGKKAVAVGKTVAIDTGNKLLKKGFTKALTPKSQAILQKHTGIPMQQSSPDTVAKKVESILSKY